MRGMSGSLLDYAAAPGRPEARLTDDVVEGGHGCLGEFGIVDVVGHADQLAAGSGRGNW